MALAVVGLLVLASAWWSCTGSLARTAAAEGILTHAEGSFALQSPVAGQITGTFVEPGSTFPVNAPLFTVRVDESIHTIRSISGGRATAVLGQAGQVIVPGTQLAVIERIDGPTDPLVAELYVPQDRSGLIRTGQPVDLEVQSAPAAQYGVLRGTVVSISQFPENTRQISDFLGDEQLGTRFSTQGQPLRIVVRLRRDRTASGWEWSTRHGPPYQIDSRTLVSAQIHVAPIKPVRWVVA
ncbi:HlyD family efflux transporter periplasmic adaptor subunit [Streptomyces sp. NPDC006173]|uniref:HlyD family efflux transporter periplasmic adaptor subunit n=1 Tax=Streptomyces sp. NPDC006173 TaxID=3155349 RepID=UPI00340E6630